LAEKSVLSITEKVSGTAELSKAFELLDHMASKGIIHRNTAARHKAKLTRHVNAIKA
jgi:small subunit ribosomal protein S20